MASESEIRSIIAEVLEKHFTEPKLLRFDVNFTEDFDGEKIIRVIAHLAKPSERSEPIFAAADDIRERLAAAGDERFVFLRQDYPRPPENESGEEDVQTGGVQ